MRTLEGDEAVGAAQNQRGVRGHELELVASGTVRAAFALLLLVLVRRGPAAGRPAPDASAAGGLGGLGGVGGGGRGGGRSQRRGGGVRVVGRRKHLGGSAEERGGVAGAGDSRCVKFRRLVREERDVVPRVLQHELAGQQGPVVALLLAAGVFHLDGVRAGGLAVAHGGRLPAKRSGRGRRRAQECLPACLPWMMITSAQGRRCRSCRSTWFGWPGYSAAQASRNRLWIPELLAYARAAGAANAAASNPILFLFVFTSK